MHTRIQPRQFARHRAGEIVTARVANPLENASTAGKARPVVLLRRDGARWLVHGLTTKARFANGMPRVQVPDPASCGLRAGPTYLWGRATWICTLDVGDHIGDADDALRALIAALH